MRPLLALSAVAAMMSVIAAGQVQRPVFRAASDLVAVPVAVMDGNTPVSGLTAADFELRASGIVQTIDYVAAGDAAIDLTLVVDASTWFGEGYGTFERDLERLSALLEPADRVRVLIFDTAVRESLPLTPVRELSRFPRVGSGGIRAVNDAVATALMSSRIDDRRQLVVLLTAGPDTASAVDTSRLLALAGWTNAALHTYALDRTPADGRPVFVPRSEVEWLAALEQAARRTGGRPHSYRNSAVGSLRALLEDFRDSYVLYFRPSGLSDASWHDLSVTVSAAGVRDYTVFARTGYGLRPPLDERATEIPDTAEPVRSQPIPPDTGPTPTSAEVTADSLPRLFERYSRGECAEVASELLNARNVADVADMLRREGQRWIESALPGTASRRRDVVAALALEVARPTHSLADSFKTSPAIPWNDRRDLILWGGELLSGNLTVSDTERAWYLGAIASFRGMLQFTRRMAGWQAASDLLTQAMARVPDEGRHRWNHGRTIDERLETDVRLRAQVARTELFESATSYEAAASRGDDNLLAEIQLHILSRFLRANRDTDEALGPFIDAGRREATTEALARVAYAESIASEDFLIYMARFFRGRIYDRLDQRSEAEAAYRSALEMYPRAQSARLGLATLLHLRGDDTAARQLSESALHAPEGEDPWHVYHLGDYRRLPLYIDQMRAALSAGR